VLDSIASFPLTAVLLYGGYEMGIFQAGSL
jgi:hypothetical protein